MLRLFVFNPHNHESILVQVPRDLVLVNFELVDNHVLAGQVVVKYMLYLALLKNVSRLFKILMLGEVALLYLLLEVGQCLDRVCNWFVVNYFKLQVGVFAVAVLEIELEF